MNPQKTDEALMQDYQLGHMDALAEIYKRYEGRLMGYLLKKQLPRFDAEEICQRVFMKFHETRLNYSPKYPLSAWVFTITKSVMVDYLRFEKRRQHQDLNEHQFKQPMTHENEVEIYLNKLNPDESTMLKQRYLEDKTFEAMAHDLGITEATVRKRISRSLAKLKGFLKGVTYES